MLSEGNRPSENVQQPRPWPIVAQRARMHEFFRRRLRAAREESRDCAWVYRNEIVAEGEAMGLNEAQSLAMAQEELERNWYVPGYWTGRRHFTGVVFTDFPGLCRRYGYSS
jgi:hypothetical protein